ncbi:TonB-dependent receptor [Thermomonas sp. HDW16]|uniref:TonB-dependent receptor plug domain-containing protein n=1 Tax=Thermomonas sp. HDW16 TaxID=2714945 RepID=UPI0014079866|nr:TonB-dependent receptor [Thermomonas sp. HDW16]QIL20308.1 TonB-dependent receptor [Thermomonas sp. HDW16]
MPAFSPIALPDPPRSRYRAPLHHGLGLALAVALAAPASASDNPPTGRDKRNDDSVFELGSVVVRGKRSQLPPNGEVVLTREQLDALNRETVGEAVAVLPGVNLSRNARNEDLVFVRGFDPRQVPVFLDGIPQYVPYDGYIDFGRFTTFDLAEIHVAKGTASLLYGPNTLGGAINLVTRKPSEPFQGDLRVGAGSGGERMAAANIGARKGMWYLQAGLSWRDANSFPLPDGFQDYKRVPTDTGDERENADRSDRRASIKIGLMPNDRDEYAIGYVRQDGEKGNPVYTGTANQGIRYWRWPYWDKESLYFIGNIGLGATSALKLRLYEDRYGNGLDAYTDASYSTPILSTSFPSVYEDRTRGASAELAFNTFERHDLRLALHYKEDRHEDRNPRSPDKRYRDVTTSIALEDGITLNDRYRLRLGASHEQRKAREVYFWPTGSTSANNALAELTRDVGEDGQLFAGISRKTRFPTIKDRYSARMGRALPNPNLKPETARHLELGWRGQAWTGARVEATLFRSSIDEMIQDTQVASTACGGMLCDQAQNIGEARHRGVELALQQRIGERVQLGGNYTWLDADNRSNPAIPITHVPRQRLFLHASWAPSPQWEAVATVEAERGRTVPYSGSGRSAFIPLDGYASIGLKGVWTPHAGLAIEVGGRNLGDRWYELSEGFPMPGRSWFANVIYRF